MKYQAIDKFEYKYVKLRTSLPDSISYLNEEGKNGWELIELIKPSAPMAGDVYKALLKRRITEVTI